MGERPSIVINKRSTDLNYFILFECARRKLVRPTVNCGFCIGSKVRWFEINSYVALFGRYPLTYNLCG
jgi:hypothetical protein